MLVAPEIIAGNGESVSAVTGERFFARLVHNLTAALNADLAAVCKFLPENPVKLSVLAIFVDGGEGKTFDCNLENTPCAQVVNQGISIYPDDVQRLFPLDTELSGMRARAFAGAPMYGSDGRLLGVIKVAARLPFRDLHAVQSTLALFAAQAASELERRQAIAALRAAELRCTEFSAQLEAVNAELESFSYSVSHDFRAAVQGLAACSRVVVEDYSDRLDETGKHWLNHIRNDADQLDRLTRSLLELSRVSRADMHRSKLDLTGLSRQIGSSLMASEPQRSAEFNVAEGLEVHGDESLVRTVMLNLLGNAWKFSSQRKVAHIEVGSIPSGSNGAFFVRDNGAGFDMKYSGRLFGAFQRLHPPNEFAGPGIGLATVRRVIHRHGGRVWAEGTVDEGATIYFTLSGHSVL
jgi:signal transduction histidine kinase